MYTVIYIVILGLLVWWCVAIAKSNGRNTVLAGFMGFFFGILAVIVYMFMGKTEAKKRQEVQEIVNSELAKVEAEKQRIATLVQ
jgi:hypothetical protein